jgi:hypothetical protein
MIGRLPPRAGGPPAGGEPLADRGPRGGFGGTLSANFLCIWVYGPSFV